MLRCQTKHFKVFQQVNSLTEIKPGSLCHITTKKSGADELPGLLMVDGQVLCRCKLQTVLPHSQPPGNVPTKPGSAAVTPLCTLVLRPGRTRAALHTRGEFLLAQISSAASGTSYAQTVDPGPIYQAIHSDSQVRLIIKTRPLSLWGSPGLCLMQQTDGTEEIQVVHDEIWDFLMWLLEFFK